MINIIFVTIITSSYFLSVIISHYRFRVLHRAGVSECIKQTYKRQNNLLKHMSSYHLGIDISS